MKKVLFSSLLCGIAAVASFGSAAVPMLEAILPVNAYAAAPDCKDDPRLRDIVHIMENPQQISPPITVTPETFLALNKDVLARLAGQMTICPDNHVLKNGNPMKKVPVDFEPVWNKIRTAAMNNDFKTAQTLVQSFTVKAKTPEEVGLLLTPTGLDEKVNEQLYQALGMSYDKYKSDKTSHVIDFFTILGGKSSREKSVVIAYDKIDAKQKGQMKDVLILDNLMPSGGATWASSYVAIFANKLKAAGLTVVGR